MFKDINKVVRTLVVVDFFVNSAFGSFGPIFAIFITGQIEGGTASVVGLATAVYWITKSIFQLPIARFLDKTKGEKDDFWALFLGYFFGGLTIFGYLFVTKPWHVFIIQAFYGFFMAWAVPSWYAIFTRHVDKWRISFEWSLQSVFSVGVAIAASAALGGYAVDEFGFGALFVIAGLVATIPSLLLLNLKKHLIPKKDGNKVMPEHHIHHQ